MPQPSSFRLTAECFGGYMIYSLARNDTILFTALNRSEAGEWMLHFSIDNPLHLLQAAERWGGLIEIRESGTERRRPYRRKWRACG